MAAIHTVPDIVTSVSPRTNYMDVQQMYNMVNKQDTAWGIEGYRTPRLYHDARESKMAEKKKAPYATKRGNFIASLEKTAGAIPAPNQYNVVKPWADETKTKGPPKNVSKKITYLEQIGLENQKRPIPGVGAYNLQKEIPKDDNKQASPKKSGAERTNFLCDYEYLSNSSPGPGNYNPRDVQPKVKEAKLKPEDWRKKHAEELKSPKKVAAADVGAYSPIPAAYDTFDKMLSKHIAQKSSKGKMWGNEVRFDFEKKHTKPEFVVPGPGQYNMTATWSNESPKGKSATFKDPHWMNKITKGPSKSIYY